MKLIPGPIEKTFEPFSLVVETKEEALLLVHRLNMSTTMFMKEYKQTYPHAEKNELAANKFAMFNMIFTELERQQIKMS